MIEPTNQQNDPIESADERDVLFAERLRRTDRPVCLNAEQWAEKVVQARRANSTRQRRRIVISGVAALAMAAFALIMMNRAPRANPLAEGTLPTAHETPGSPNMTTADSPSFPIADAPILEVDAAVDDDWDDSRAAERLLELENRIQDLQEIRRRQQWSLTREMASRSDDFRNINQP